MAGKTLLVFVAGAAVGAGAMWLLGISPDAADPSPALAGPEVTAAPQAALPSEPAPLPKPPPVAQAGEAEPEERSPEWAARQRAARDARPSMIEAGQSPAHNEAQKKFKLKSEKKNPSTVVLGDGAVTFRMFRTPEQVYGKELVATAKSADHSSAEFAKVLKQLIGDIGSEDGDTAQAARRLLDDLIAKGRLAPHQLAEIEREYTSAEVGSTERAQFAAMLARAKAGDPGVRDFLDGLDRAGDVEASRSALHAFEHPNQVDPAVHAWRRKIIAEGAEDGLLADALQPHRMAAWSNRNNAADYVGAIADRLEQGGLKSTTRGRALRSVATAGIHAPQAAAAALQRAAQSDPDAKVAAFAKDAAALVRSGTANSDTLQKAWNQQYPPSEVMTGGTIILEGDFSGADGTDDGDDGDDDAGEKKNK
jgi:hypothetical protein